MSELSRLGRSLGQIIQAVDQLLKKGVSLIAIKESIRLEGKQDLQTKVTIGPSKLDGKEGEIQMLLGKKVSKASIAKILDVAPSTLHSFIQSRRLEHKKRRQA